MLAQEHHGQLPHRWPGHHRLHGQYREHRDAAYVRCEGDDVVVVVPSLTNCFSSVAVVDVLCRGD